VSYSGRYRECSTVAVMEYPTVAVIECVLQWRL
jgi:hypothetical protein